MERHFDRDLEELKQRLLWMGSLAERAVHQAVHAVLDADEHLAETVLSEEDTINEMQIEIDDRVQRLLALRAPMAAICASCWPFRASTATLSASAIKL